MKRLHVGSLVEHGACLITFSVVELHVGGGWVVLFMVAVLM